MLIDLKLELWDEAIIWFINFKSNEETGEKYMEYWTLKEHTCRRKHERLL